MVEIAADVIGGNYVSSTFTNLSLDNAGTFQLDPNTTLLIGGDVALTGGGTVELMTATEQYAAAIAGAKSGTLDNFNDTIKANGDGASIGIDDQSLTFINKSGGTVDADGNDSSNDNGNVSIALDTGNTVTNDGILEATNGGTLLIENSTLANTGNVQAGAGSQVDLSNATISGGTVSTAANGLIVGSGASAIDNATIINNGELEIGGTFTASSGATISGSGNVVIANGGVADFLDAFNQAVTFVGAGTLELAQSSSFNATVADFNSGGNSGDIVDLADVAFAANETFVWTQNGANGTLKIYTGTTLDRSLNLAGTYSESGFALTTNYGTGTEVIASPGTVDDFRPN